MAPDSEPVAGYRLVAPLGRGGFAEVWQAIGPDGPVALKFVPQTARAAAVEWRSIEVVRLIAHPNLLPTHGAWQTDDFLVIAMELADRTLFDRWREAQAQGSPGIPRDELIGYFRAAAEGIDYLQKRYIQHRDVKPQNLLLVGGTLKVGDFGLTRLLAHSVTGHTGSLTLAYAAPEFFDGKTTRHSDQYSLAVAYCQMRGGKLPFDGTPAAMVAAHLHRPPDLSMLPEAERPAVAKALAKRPEQRWPTCRAFVEAVADPQPAPRARLGRRLLYFAAAALLLGLALLFVLLPAATPVVAVRPFERIEQGQLMRSVAVSAMAAPFDRRIALSNGSGSPVMWDVASGTPIRKLAHAGGACAALAPFQALLGATGHDDGLVILWDLRTGDEIGRFAEHTSSVNCVAFAPDGQRLLSGACDNTLRLWDRRTQKQIHCLRGHQGFVSCVAFDMTGRRAVSGTWDGTVRLWDLNGGTQVKEFTGHTSWVNGVGFSTDGRYAVSGASDRTVRVWDVASGAEAQRIEGAFETISSVGFVGLDRVLIADGGTARLVDLATDHDVLRSAAQPSIILGIGFVGVPGGHAVVLGTERDGLQTCVMP